jgi:hypothetical protein
MKTKPKKTMGSKMNKNLPPMPPPPPNKKRKKRVITYPDTLEEFNLLVKQLRKEFKKHLKDEAAKLHTRRMSFGYTMLEAANTGKRTMLG